MGCVFKHKGRTTFWIKYKSLIAIATSAQCRRPPHSDCTNARRQRA
jgi:hypothetical protein